MNILCLQHVAFETPGCITEWIVNHNHQIEYKKFFDKNWSFSTVKHFDMLLIMGGPMSVHDEKKYNWLISEKQFIKRAIQNGKKVLGICLGAQLIAECIGGKVRKNEYKEIGWHEIFITDEGLSYPVFQGEDRLKMVFHWHGETFTLPPDTLSLASSTGCKHQAFAYGPNILGLQFHPEMTRETLEILTDHEKEELLNAPGPYIQSELQIRGGTEYIKPSNDFMFRILDRFTS